MTIHALASPASDGADPDCYGPWSPGIESSLPRALLPLATVFREENVETSLNDAYELSDVSGLPLTSLVCFRPERLVVHEVLIRVMADLSVPVGQTYGDLGVNFRAIVSAILNEGIAEHGREIAARHAEIRVAAAELLDGQIDKILGEYLHTAEGWPPRGALWRRFWPHSTGRKSSKPSGSACVGRDPIHQVWHHLDAWHARVAAAEDALAVAACAALRCVVESLIGRRGFLIRDPSLLGRLAVTLVSNGYGSLALGALIEPWMQAVVAKRGYVRLKPQDTPVILNVKGSSASGKSTIRPYQRALVETLGLNWSDFALITPDVWRKFLLDYDSLGSARRYAGPLTGHEVEIIDRKLDGYMARKAEAGRISHLVIDRFRFDSFAVNPGTELGSQLLTRFGRQVYMQFMITPPDATVERAWKRGEQFGRYKAVEDLLAHNVEAYTGMPRLFFTWVLRPDKEVHFEFLDNGVPEGCLPRTVAFGANGVMNILDVQVLLDIDRYQAINIQARNPEAVYRGVPPRDAPGEMRFLRDCLRRMTTIRFADHATGRVLARLDSGRLTSLVPTLAEADPVVHRVLTGLGVIRQAEANAGSSEALQVSGACTLGAWGEKTTLRRLT
ncbi:hypothetical protein [Methylobacterium sp. Leaf465]|uniref:hypothetical protein n=1 Tax=Methylobacterium sp. Leaf465 TaxID=1736385 RepID=UPI0009EABBE4|nr:hypothetical protein [Methylobacterium sp. Leaf465]